jgi:hypothetical protein
VPQELQARQATIRHALGQLARQQQRLLDAYLAGVLDLDTFERKRRDLAQQETALTQQQRELAVAAQQRHDLAALAAGAEEFCAQVRSGLANATFAQRRALVELLIDRVVVTDGVVEIRYAIPTSRDGPHHPFCRLRKDYRVVITPAQVFLDERDLFADVLNVVGFRQRDEPWHCLIFGVDRLRPKQLVQDTDPPHGDVVVAQEFFDPGECSWMADVLDQPDRLRGPFPARTSILAIRQVKRLLRPDVSQHVHSQLGPRRE